MFARFWEKKLQRATSPLLEKIKGLRGKMRGEEVSSSVGKRTLTKERRGLAGQQSKVRTRRNGGGKKRRAATIENKRIL